MFSKRARRDWVLITLRPLTSGLKDMSEGNSFKAYDIIKLFWVVIKFPQFLQFPLFSDCGKMFLIRLLQVRQAIGCTLLYILSSMISLGDFIGWVALKLLWTNPQFKLLESVFAEFCAEMCCLANGNFSLFKSVWFEGMSIKLPPSLAMLRDIYYS